MRKKFAIIIGLHILGGIIMVIPSSSKKSKMIKSLKVITIKEPSLKCSSPITTKTSSTTSFSTNQNQQTVKTITNNKQTLSPSPTQKIDKPINNTKTSPSFTSKAPDKLSISPANNKKLLELTKQSLKQIKGMETDLLQKQDTSSPSFIDSIQPSFSSSITEIKLENIYAEQLMLTLKNHLTLPAFGDTILSLTISPQGQLLNISFDLSDNPENEEYLKRQLPLLSFPVNNGLSKNLQPIKIKIRLIGENLVAIS